MYPDDSCWWLRRREDHPLQDLHRRSFSRLGWWLLPNCVRSPRKRDYSAWGDMQWIFAVLFVRLRNEYWTSGIQCAWTIIIGCGLLEISVRRLRPGLVRRIFCACMKADLCSSTGTDPGGPCWNCPDRDCPGWWSGKSQSSHWIARRCSGIDRRNIFFQCM